MFLRNLVAVFCMVSFVLQTGVALSGDDVSSVKKSSSKVKKTKKSSSKRASSTSGGKSRSKKVKTGGSKTGSKRAAVSNSSAVPVRESSSKSSNSKRAASSSSKTTRNSSSGLSKSPNSKRSASSKSASAKSSSSRSSDTTKTTSSGATTATNGAKVMLMSVATKCKESYVSCMDSQITALLSNYSYLGEDEAVDKVLETKNPFRCVYHYDLKNNKKSDIDVNSLYYAYNYYCEPKSTTNSAGQAINKCDATKASGTSAVYASKKSYAYYKEAYDRMMADDLKILNFQNTSLYKNKLAEMNLSSSNSVSSNDVSDLLSSFGIDTSGTTSSTDLFSVTISPPDLAGSLEPKDAFLQAHEICMGIASLPDTKSSGISSSVLKDIKKYVRKLTTDSCQALETTLKNYYLDGTWYSCPKTSSYNDESKSCIATDGTVSDASLKEDGFVSTGKSCDSYEDMLMGKRNTMYGTFKDQLVNYLDEKIADLIAKEVKK